MKNMKYLDGLSVFLVLLGAICWGLIGAFGFDLVGSMFDASSNFARGIYVLIGLSGLYRIGLWAKAHR